jgi:hypothetical protein
VPSGDRLELDRLALATQLKAVTESAAYLSEQRRRAQVGAGLAELARQATAKRVRLPAPRSASAAAASLPPSVRLYRDRLVVDFPAGDQASLLAQLLAVAKAARDDPEGFRSAVEGATSAEHHRPAGDQNG